MVRLKADRERGMGLLLCVVVAAVLMTICGALLCVAIVQTRAGVTRRQSEVAMRTLDGSIAIAISRIQRTLDAGSLPPEGLAGTVPPGGAGGLAMPWAVNLRRNAANPTLWKISAAAGNVEAYRSQQVVVERPDPIPPVPGAFRGALSSYFGFPRVKNAQVSGNDVLSADGSPNPSGTNTRGISVATGAVTFQGGSGQIGGLGQPLAHAIDSDRVEIGYGGLPFPRTPLEALGLASYPAGMRTFATLAEWQAFVSALPSANGRRVMPDYQFLNLTFQAGTSVMFGEVDWGTTEHILIWHHENPSVNSDPAAPKGDAGCNNIHLGESGRPFKGIAILDDWKHVNGSSNIRGGFISLSGTVQDGLQGNTTITFSSQAVGWALARAGSAGGPGALPRVISYRENVNDAEVRAAFEAIGVTVPSAGGEGSAGWEIAN